ncbi:S26 family signal peptidase [Streptomyces sp. NPDC051940]|uniref:S26 family signal peptidase n=1 Tax=Streptomyces sp. NPDC051940 TaxID=3155675 RepID=UPI00341942BC
MTAVARAVLAAVLAGAGGALLARRRLAAVTVRGGSMTPTLLPGDVLLVLRGPRTVRRGRIVVVPRPDPATGWREPAEPLNARGWYVKRVVAVPGDPVPDWVAGPGGTAPGARVPAGMLVLRGDHPRSEDSRRWGYCPADQLYGVMLLRLPGRREFAGPGAEEFAEPGGPGFAEPDGHCFPEPRGRERAAPHPLSPPPPHSLPDPAVRRPPGGTEPPRAA